MARPLNKKVIQDRIKDNKAIMTSTKKIVTEAMKNSAKGIDARATRAALAEFIKASNAVNDDNLKLALITE